VIFHKNQKYFSIRFAHKFPCFDPYLLYGQIFIHTGGKSMKKTVLALISCTAAVLLLGGCGSAAGATSQLPDAQEESEQVQDFPGTGDEEILIDREDPTIEVTAEEFQDRQGYTFNVPDGAEDVIYLIDTESNCGSMTFTLDGVGWTAVEIQRDVEIPLSHPYYPEGSTEQNCDFINDPAMKVHGADGEAYGYYEKVSEDWEYYYYSADWYLANEGYSIALFCYSDAPIDSMPVEVFP
jgi:hypothetical protein